MASETRRAAQGLVARRSERFESRHSLDESRARLERQLARADVRGAVHFTTRWSSQAERAVLEAEFAPARSTQGLLRGLSLCMALLVGASAWAIFSTQDSPVLRYLLPIFTLLAILGVPLAATGLGSHRQAEEARILKAIRLALLEEDAPG
jgi:hypothetical protein